MFKDIFKSVCLSLLIIVLLHYLFNYLQDSLTVPKVKDLVERPKEKYDSIMKVVNTETEQPTMTNTQNYNETDSLNMQSELNNYVSQINSQGNLETSAVSNMNQVRLNKQMGDLVIYREVRTATQWAHPPIIQQKFIILNNLNNRRLHTNPLILIPCLYII